MSSNQNSQQIHPSLISPANISKDLTAGLVVFLVALPLCLGIALASGVNLFAGIIAGIIGGLVVGAISGSHTSVSGPAAGLTAVVAAQIALTGSFEAFLLAVVLSGVIQIVMGVMRAGAISAFFPTSVIKGLLAAIGVILILKQIPHVLGHDTDPEGEMSFKQPDHENTFSEIWNLFQGEVHAGAIVVGAISIALLVLWAKWKPLKNSGIPGPLVVVLLGVAINELILSRLGGKWVIEGSHLVDLPVLNGPSELMTVLTFPDFSQILNPTIYIAATTVAVVASLETLLNLEAVDKLDRYKRNSPPSRELIAQGVGNICSGLIGGLPITSVVIRGSVNCNMGARTKLSTISHGALLVISVAFLPTYMKMIPLAALAAILLVTGFKLASPALFKQMWNAGRQQFAPFLITLLAIVFTDLLIGILIGLGVSIVFILNSNVRRPIKRILEMSANGEVLHIELSNQVSFLNKAALDNVFNEIKPGSNLLIDASEADYIDPDILSLIREYKEEKAPAHGVKVNLQGFRKKYNLENEEQFASHTTPEAQVQSRSDQVQQVLEDGNERFRAGKQIKRDFSRQVSATASGQHPLAAVLSCIDSRVPVELVFDLGIGDIFSVRVAGNVLGNHALGSLEYAVGVAKVKLVVVMGHTRCGAVKSSVQLVNSLPDRQNCPPALSTIVDEIETVIQKVPHTANCAAADDEDYLYQVTEMNVEQTVDAILEQSDLIRAAVEAGEAQIVGAIYDVATAEVKFLAHETTVAKD